MYWLFFFFDYQTIVNFYNFSFYCDQLYIRTEPFGLFAEKQGDNVDLFLCCNMWLEIIRCCVSCLWSVSSMGWLFSSYMFLGLFNDE